ncbi:hypothetical protein [Actinomadura oligospora]|uniref:hypothetical protein n=1 Tax=Actinomadura oligospora TaxID=111804 RepID=UPI00047D3BDC|nr:hypothetical protein [Actinomadura oligospora]
MADGVHAIRERSRTMQRWVLLSGLMVDLRGLGCGSWLAFPGDGEPVLFVRARVSGRRVAVLAMEDGAGQWLFRWDGDQQAAAIEGDASCAAERIAAVRR